MVQLLKWRIMVPSVIIQIGLESDICETTTGIQLAGLADLPRDVLTEAEQIAHQFSNESKWKHEKSESSKVARRRKAVLKVCWATSHSNC